MLRLGRKPSFPEIPGSRVGERNRGLPYGNPFGMNTFAEIRFIGCNPGLILRGSFQGWLYVYQGADEVAKFFVEIG